MERKTFTSNQKPLPSSPQNYLITKPQSHRRVWFICAVTIILLFLGIGIFFTLQQERQKIEHAEKLAAMTPTAMPTPTPASPSADFVFYADLDGEEKFAVAYNFTDPVLGVSFAYPPGYMVQSLKADEKNKQTGIYFINPGNSEKIARVREIIACDVANRKDPSGICRESMIGDVEVGIYPYTKTTFDQETNANCRKEIATKNRVLFSCVTQMSVDASDRGMEYTLYLLGENPTLLRINTRDPKKEAHLIRSIISSATNKLN